MIIVCPKFSYYSALNEETKSAVRAKIKEVISEYVKGKPTIFLEDTFAKSLLGDVSDTITITDERDFSQMKNFHYYESESFMEQFYNYEKHEICPFVKFENPPTSLLLQDREQYRDKRIAAYEKRLLQSAKYMAVRHKAVLSFIGNTASKSKVEIKPSENDGILNIMFNLSTNITNCYYSGVWVDVEVAKQILGGLYG